MSGELVPFTGFLPALIGEARRRRIAMGVIFAVIALLALGVGLVWPKKYEASTTILAEESSIITPLMEGAASATGNKNRAGIARDVIFSRRVLDEVLRSGGWLANSPSALERDKIIDGIKGRTKIINNRENLITITYFDSDPKRAFEVTRAFGQLFISESLASKQRESREAYEFINSQVEAYRGKLTDAEGKLKSYRDANADARPGNDVDTNSRISQLRTQIENNRMDYMQKQSQAASIASQINGESEVNAVQTVGGIYTTQLGDLQGQLDKLLLNYTEDYPDVIRLRHQIEDVRRQAQTADAQRAAGGPMPIDHSTTMNPVYQQMRVQLSAVRGDAAASAARVSASEGMLQSELERSKRIASSENVIAELTRDYNVNRDVYQDLLKRRENARVSMNLDAEQRGLTFLVQNPAVMPLVPSGLRFMHFGLAGLALSLAIPFSLLFAVARFDPRVRSVGQLERATGFPVLASIPFYPTPRDRRRDHLHNMMLGLIVAGVGAVYLLLFWMRMKG
ncbi:polysaccharide chain length determinant protein (PEP-CTERM system associated) [Luteibacter sp. OK325]|uniref:XrtA system polysaccharide chain length determinant n=1 Tax=Luteibacter sp. OK325 TaxID=2135670 RepID=UPI000D3BD6BA|nr:XrtA system polysaccharide chain length determinant [Luteibacter sp. OK325]PTR33818.1 polysaccharide chain length determinant protein (PEP-CTERM system associated) [Luteibacter sp. OK325]